MQHERPYVIVVAGFEPVRDIVARVCPVGYQPTKIIDAKYVKRHIDPFILLSRGESFMWCLDLETAADRRKVVEDIQATSEDLDYEIILVANEEHRFKSRPKIGEGFDSIYWDSPDRKTTPVLTESAPAPRGPALPKQAPREELIRRRA